MKPYEFSLNAILFSPETMAAFADALRAWKPEYTGRFVVLDEGTRYVKLLVEYQTDWCAAELWIYGKDGQAFPEQFPFTGAELIAITLFVTPL